MLLLHHVEYKSASPTTKAAYTPCYPCLALTLTELPQHGIVNVQQISALTEEDLKKMDLKLVQVLSEKPSLSLNLSV